MVSFPSRQRFAVTSLTLFRLLVVTLLLSLTAGCGLFDVEDVLSESPQTWALTNNVGQVATVVVSPFTNSGTFGETANSTGWWLDFPMQPPCSFRLTVGGNITKASPGDHWTFVTLGGSGCGHQALGTGEGTANGNFPNANLVTNGTLLVNFQGPGVDAGIIGPTVPGTWTAVRIN